MCRGGMDVERSGIEQVRAGLTTLAGADVVGLPDAQVRTEILQLLACANQLAAVLAERVGSFDTRQLARDDGLRTTQTWLAGYGRMSKGVALGWLSRARLMRKLPALAEGMRSGRVSTEQVELVGKLAWHVGVDAVRQFDRELTELAATADPKQVGQACARIHAHIDPDGAEPDPGKDWDRREVSFARCGSMTYLRGRLDPEGAALLQTALDALMRPPSAQDASSAAQRRADALVELARHAIAAATLPTVGGTLPHLAVLVTPQQLLHGPTDHDSPQQTDGGDPLTKAGVPPAKDRPWLSWAGEVSPELAQRLACDSIVWRVILDPASGLPLDVGRQHRLVPAWMRKALHTRDRTCRWPGCDTPAAWTDAHHEIPWHNGGPTDIDNLISLCRYHHGLVHEGHWTLHQDHTTGEVWITRPDGTPYELGPSRPYTSTSRQGPAQQGGRPRTSPSPLPRAA